MKTPRPIELPVSTLTLLMAIAFASGVAVTAWLVAGMLTLAP